MPKSLRLSLSILAVVALAAAGFWFAFRPSEETRIERFVERGRDAVNSLSWTRLEPLIHPQYSDSHGWDRAMLLQTARSAFQDCQDLAIEIEETDIQIEPGDETATVRIRYRAGGVLKSGQPFLGITSDAGEPEEAILYLEKHRGDWRLHSIELEELR